MKSTSNQLTAALLVSVTIFSTALNGLAEKDPPPAAAAPAETQNKISEEESKANKEKAQTAWDSDKKTFAKDFKDLETEYQEINKNYKTPQVKDLLNSFISKWKKGNRVGCATMYLAQKSGGEQRETLLKQCAGEFSDCYYLDGTQVGGLGRLYLASYYKQNGKTAEFKKLAEELRKDFPTAQDHSRNKVVAMLAELEK